MDELARTKVEEERDGVVALLRTIADRLHALTPSEARRSLARLASAVALLAHEAEPVSVRCRVVAHMDADPDPPPRTTVVFVRRGACASALDGGRCFAAPGGHGDHRHPLSRRARSVRVAGRSTPRAPDASRRACSASASTTRGARGGRRPTRSQRSRATELGVRRRRRLRSRVAHRHGPRRRAPRSSRSRAASTRRSSASALEGRARRGVSTTRSSVRRAGIPAVVVVTEVFENLARTAARGAGLSATCACSCCRIRWSRGPRPRCAPSRARASAT